MDYTGIDILPDMIKTAKRIRPKVKFLCVDIFRQKNYFKTQFDYVFASGIFNLDLGNNIEFIKESIKVFNEISKYGFCFNLLDNESVEREDIYYYLNYNEAVLMISNQCKLYDVKMVRGYLQNDYTIVVKKN